MGSTRQNEELFPDTVYDTVPDIVPDIVHKVSSTDSQTLPPDELSGIFYPQIHSPHPREGVGE